MQHSGRIQSIVRKPRVMATMLNIHWELQGNIGVITLDNPPGNELTRPAFMDVHQLIEWSELPEVNGIIITGAGRHFSQGAELGKLFEMASDKDFLIEQMSSGKDLLNTIEHLNIPVMAVISGLCFGGGLEIALACHLRVCSDKALFAFPEVNHGLIPGMGGSVRLSGIVGQSTALGLLLSGDTLNAEEALKIKLVDHCVPKAELLEFSITHMKKLVDAKPKQVVNAVMQAWHNSSQLSFADALSEETRLFYGLAKDELQRRNTLS